MSKKYYGITREGANDLNSTVTRSAAGTTNSAIELVLEDSVALTRADVIIALERFEKYILELPTSDILL